METEQRMEDFPSQQVYFTNSPLIYSEPALSSLSDLLGQQHAGYNGPYSSYSETALPSVNE